MTASHTQVMQATSNLDDEVREPRVGVAQSVFDNATAFHPSNHMLDLNAHGSENPIEKLLLISEFALPGLLLGLVGYAAWRFIALKSRRLAERGTAWLGNLFSIGEFFVMHFAGHGAAEINHALGLGVDQNKVLVRMRFF
jgi:hypothetical protein